MKAWETMQDRAIRVINCCFPVDSANRVFWICVYFSLPANRFPGTGRILPSLLNSTAPGQFFQRAERPQCPKPFTLLGSLRPANTESRGSLVLRPPSSAWIHLRFLFPLDFTSSNSHPTPFVPLPDPLSAVACQDIGTTLTLSLLAHTEQCIISGPVNHCQGPPPGG